VVEVELGTVEEVTVVVSVGGEAGLISLWVWEELGGEIVVGVFMVSVLVGD